MWPELTSSSPASIRMVIDFPHPEGPTSTMNSPSPISSSLPGTVGSGAPGYHRCALSNVTVAIDSLSSLDGARGETTDEVALQAEEDQHRDGHRDEGARGQQLGALSLRPEQLLQLDDHRGVVGAQEELGDQQVVPDPEELEDREGGQGRHRHRHDQAPEGLEMREIGRAHV